MLYPTDSELIVYTGTQSVYDDLREISSLLGVDIDKIRVVSKYVGGSFFGGKGRYELSTSYST